MIKFIRLNKTISTGLVLKILLPTVSGEIEHSIHIIFNGSIIAHTHSESCGITEGYREIDLETGNPKSWEVVGAGMPTHLHSIPFKAGLRIIEGSKRGSGIECWPELSTNYDNQN